MSRKKGVIWIGENCEYNSIFIHKTQIYSQSSVMLTSMVLEHKNSMTKINSFLFQFRLLTIPASSQYNVEYYYYILIYENPELCMNKIIHIKKKRADRIRGVLLYHKIYPWLFLGLSNSLFTITLESTLYSLSYWQHRCLNDNLLCRFNFHKNVLRNIYI
jgi:hypothetical protein